MMPVPTLDGSTAVDMPPYFGGDELHTDPTEHDRRQDTSAVETERPDVLLLVKIACEATDGSVYSAWVADPGREPLLVGAFNPDLIPQGTAEFILGRRHGVPRRVEVVDFDAFRSERVAAAQGDADTASTTVPTWQDYEARITGTATIPLSDLSESCVLMGEVAHWPVQPATAEGPAFPASTDVSIGVAGTFFEMTPEKALAFAPKFGEFERAVTELAKQAIAERDGDNAPAVPRIWSESVRGGGTVGGIEPGYCQGHPELKYPEHVQDVAHTSKQIGVTAQCVDGPLGVLMAYITERPYDTVTELGDGPKILLTADEEHETRVLDEAGARKFAVDVRAWLADFEALVEQMGTEVPGGADG